MNRAKLELQLTTHKDEKFIQNDQPQSRGLIHLKKSFKDCARPSPPPSSDTTFWPSLKNGTSKNNAVFPKLSYTSLVKLNSSSNGNATVWDKRINQKETETFEPIKRNSLPNTTIVDWFDIDDTNDNLKLDETHFPKSFKYENSSAEKQPNVEFSHKNATDATEELVNKEEDSDSQGWQFVRKKSERNNKKIDSNQDVNCNATKKEKYNKRSDIKREGRNLYAIKSENSNKRCVNLNVIKTERNQNKRGESNRQFENLKNERNSSKRGDSYQSVANKSEKNNKMIDENKDTLNYSKNNPQAIKDDTDIKKEISYQESKGYTKEQKQIRSLEKKFKREAKIKLQREQSKRDTKIRFVSADEIRSFSSNSLSTKPGRKVSSKQILDSESSHKSSAESVPDFPKLCRNDYENKPLSYAAKAASSSKGRSSSNNRPMQKPSKAASNPGVKASNKHRMNEVRAVKGMSKNPIIFDLLAAVKTPEQKKAKMPKSLGFPVAKEKSAVKKKGKVREKQKKRLSVLKKNMIAQRRAQQENFLFFLAKQLIDEKENNPNSSTTCQTKIIEQKKDDTSEHAKNNSSNENVQLTNKKKKERPAKHLGDPLMKQKDLISDQQKACNVAKSKLKESPAGNSNSAISKASKENTDYLKLVQISETRIDKYRNVDWHQNILSEVTSFHNFIHGSKFREYCDQLLKSEIDCALEGFLRAIVTLQFNHYKRDPAKAKMRQRCYYGLKETMKHMTNMSCIVIAPDIKRAPGPGNLDELVYKVINEAKSRGIPVIFGLNLQKLKYICFKKALVSCVGIVNYDGTQEMFSSLMEQVTEARQKYQELLVKYKTNTFVNS